MWISEVKYQDPRTGTYLGSPSILRLPDGDLLATHDYFGPGCPKSDEGMQHLTSVYRSDDDGRSWRNVTHVSGAFWSNLFEHAGATYLLGCSAEWGGIVIRRSDDGGYTWTHPADEQTGLLYPGGRSHEPPSYHCAPMPVLVAQGRVYRAFENNDAIDWPRGFKACVISADVGADLLNVSSWTISNRLVYDQDTDPVGYAAETERGAGWLEGNAVEGPDGRLWDILRVASDPVLNKAAMVALSSDGRELSFDPATGFVDFPGGLSKFAIRRDPETGAYWTMSNDMQDTPYPVRRNRLSLFSSDDLQTWTKRRLLLEDNLESDPEASAANTGFQYVDWQFDHASGELNGDLIYLVRTAYDGAHNFHDANRMTFGRVKDFRRLMRG